MNITTQAEQPLAPPTPAALRSAITQTALWCAIALAIGYALHAIGALHLAETALGKDKVLPPNFEAVQKAADTIKGNIIAYVLLVLPAMVIFAGACVLVGLRLGQDLLGKIAGGLVILIAVSPALLA